MVVGLDRWRAHFAEFQDRYVLVGGVACDEHMSEAGLPFRPTKDLDIVLIVEALDASFADAFWAFVEAGGYEVRSKAEGGNLYRFQKPSGSDYPFMIELFSRAPDGFALAVGSHLTPLPIEDAAASMSAILLDAAYYAYLRDQTVDVKGMPLLSEAALIPFKARAHLDLADRKASGQKVDGKDVRKHRSDVFKLLQLLPARQVHALPDAIKADMAAFIESVRADEGFKVAEAGVKMDNAEALARLAAAYGL